MVSTIRGLLKLLAEDEACFERLCVVLRVARARGEPPRASFTALSRACHGKLEVLLGRLRKVDLLRLLGAVTGDDGLTYTLVDAARQSRARLLRRTVRVFRDGRLGRGFVVVGAAASGHELARPAGSRGRQGHGGASYRAQFLVDAAFSESDARQPLRPYQREAIDAVLRDLDAREPKLLHLATGGGKTRVANDAVALFLERNRGTGPVLWVTKDWSLLTQAAVDASRRHQGVRLARLGGNGQPLHPLPSVEPAATDRAEVDIVYSTVQTMERRLDAEILHALRPSLLVWDECHWGEGGSTGELLTVCRALGIPVLGLTATPRPIGRSRYRIAYSKSFFELVELGYLARPLVEEAVRTGVRWTPRFSGPFRTITAGSLRQLAISQRRNKVIVDHYTQHQARYGKTIVFACDVAHANALATAFARRGHAVRALHSEARSEDNQEALRRFRSGEIEVLVNVEMLTHGIDVPDTRSVFLCRPTESDILFAQMIGRGSRRHEPSGKDSFHVVEFTDNVRAHGELLQSAQRYFQGTAARGPRQTALERRPRRHSFDPRGLPTWIPDLPSLPESVRGLWYRQGQTFGLEFELTAKSGRVPVLNEAWREKAAQILEALADALPGRVAEAPIEGYAGVGSTLSKDVRVWNVEFDSSAGWEVTSPVLADAEGFLEVDAACAALAEIARELGLKVNHNTGTHVHLGWLGEGEGAAEVRRALRLARLFEPGLASLVSPSRVAAFARGSYRLDYPNPYCRPLAEVFPQTVLDRAPSLATIRALANGEDARYVTFNVRPLDHQQTVEVRMHNGTLEARKILLWLSLWAQILWAATHRERITKVPDVAVLVPNEDIVALARRWLPDSGQPQQRRLLERLAERRDEIVATWRRHPTLAPWTAHAASWQTP
jgi:superfamily II DNA or RNA helicase